MIAEREYTMMIERVMASGNSFYSAAISHSQVFSMYFMAHIKDATEAAGADVYPYAYGTPGAFLIMSAGWYGWWHDPETGVTYKSVGTDTNKAVVFGMDATRTATIKAQAIADGVEVVKAVRMDTNEEV